MLERLFGKKPKEKPLKLDVGDQTLTFTSLREFDFALASRLEVPTTKISRMVKFTDEELLEEITGIRDVRQKFIEVLLKSIEKHDSISHSLRMLEPTLFSNDHKWRGLIAALNRNPETPDAFKRVALVKYLQYLAARQDMARQIYRDHQHASDGKEPPVLGEESSQVSMARLEGDHIRAASPSGEVTRLPKGEKVPLKVKPGDEVYVFLSKQPYKLRRGEHEKLILIDEEGNEQSLHHGLNVIGRDAGSDVVVGKDRKDVSRRHLVIELPDDEVAMLTDMSSYGTFIKE